MDINWGAIDWTFATFVMLVTMALISGIVVMLQFSMKGNNAKKRGEKII